MGSRSAISSRAFVCAKCGLWWLRCSVPCSGLESVLKMRVPSKITMGMVSVDYKYFHVLYNYSFNEES